jgi:hypothetical protein
VAGDGEREDAPVADDEDMPGTKDGGTVVYGRNKTAVGGQEGSPCRRAAAELNCAADAKHVDPIITRFVMTMIINRNTRTCVCVSSIQLSEEFAKQALPESRRSKSPTQRAVATWTTVHVLTTALPSRLVARAL